MDVSPKAKVVRLVDGTEVYVAPKLRDRSTTASTSTVSSLDSEKTKHSGTSKAQESKVADRAIVRVAALRSTLTADSRDNLHNVVGISGEDLLELGWNEVSIA